MERYKKKYYHENVEKLPEEFPLELHIIETTEKQTATVIFLHGLGVTFNVKLILGYRQWLVSNF